MSITWHIPTATPRLPRRARTWLANRRARQLQRETERELAELPPYLLRDVGLVDQVRARDNGGRTLDHTRPVCTALSSWQW